MMAESIPGGQRPGRLCVALQQILEIGEWPVGRRWLLLLARRYRTIRVSNLVPCVLIVVTVETQQLPVAPIGGIVVMVVVLVMDRELTQFFATEFASAPRTDPGIHLERLRPIGLLPLIAVALRFGKNLVLPVGM